METTITKDAGFHKSSRNINTMHESQIVVNNFGTLNHDSLWLKRNQTINTNMALKTQQPGVTQ